MEEVIYHSCMGCLAMVCGYTGKVAVDGLWGYSFLLI